jgi:putative membrane protein
LARFSIQWAVSAGEAQMYNKIAATVALALMVSTPAFAKEDSKPNDAQIAHIAYTAGQIDIAAGKQAMAKSMDANVRAFADEMVRDHTAVNDKALALVKKLGVTPETNSTSTALSGAGAQKLKDFDRLTGAAFDRAYIENEIAYHKTVNGALSTTLIPNAKNAELKQLLETGLKLFQEHQQHAEHLAGSIH